MNGYIYLNRKMLDWGWYDNPNTKVVFLHLLLTANWKEREYHGVTIKAGDAVFGIKSLSEHLNISVQQVRTALKHLQDTGEITVKSTNKFSVATLVNWAKYQSSGEEATNEQQTNNKQITTPEKRKKERNIFIPPTYEEVAAYMAEKNYPDDSRRFCDFYGSKGWMVGKNKMKDWKMAVNNWFRNSKNYNKPKEQVDY